MNHYHISVFDVIRPHQQLESSDSLSRALVIEDVTVTLIICTGLKLRERAGIPARGKGRGPGKGKGFPVENYCLIYSEQI